MMVKGILGLCLICVFYSCQKGNVSPADPAVTNPGVAVVFNVNKNTLLQLVNDVRNAGCTCGTTVMPPVASVTWNDQLSLAAYDHSRDMQAQNYFSHTAKDGSDPGMRITAAGYTWRAYGENIALGYSSEETVMDGWLKSEGHCRNIMSPNFKEMGAGRQGTYWTQDFGSKK